MTLPPPSAAFPPETPSDYPGLDAVIDISHHSPVRNFALAREQAGIRAVIHKASEGVGWDDPRYAERRSNKPDICGSFIFIFR